MEKVKVECQATTGFITCVVHYFTSSEYVTCFFPAEKKGLRSRCSNEGKTGSRGRVEETPCKGLSAGKGFCRARLGGRGREEKLNAKENG